MEIENRLKNLKLIIFDLDGTLLSDNGTIGEDTKKLIRELHKKMSTSPLLPEGSILLLHQLLMNLILIPLSSLWTAL